MGEDVPRCDFRSRSILPDHVPTAYCGDRWDVRNGVNDAKKSGRHYLAGAPPNFGRCSFLFQGFRHMYSDDLPVLAALLKDRSHPDLDGLVGNLHFDASHQYRGITKDPYSGIVQNGFRHVVGGYSFGRNNISLAEDSAAKRCAHEI